MITSPCASPMHQMTSWWVSPLFSTRTLGSSAARRLSACDSLSSSALLDATIAIGSSGSGIDHGRSTRASSHDERVSPVSARVRRPIAHRSPATTASAVTRVRPKGYDSAPSFSSSSWSSWPCSAPKNDVKWPDTCTAWSAVRVPEKTRTRLSRPTYGSLVVFTISATSTPLGSHSIASARGAGGGEDVRRGVLGRRREAVDREVEQLRAPDAGLRAHRDHREERRAGDRGLQVLDEHLGGDLLALEVAVHQGLVLGLLDDPLDERAAQVVVGPLARGDQAGQGGDLLTGPLVIVFGDVQRHHLVAERRLRLGKYAVVVGAGLVELGDDHGPRHADVRALAPQRAGAVVDAVVGRDHEQGAVGGPEARRVRRPRSRRTRGCRRG